MLVAVSRVVCTAYSAFCESSCFGQVVDPGVWLQSGNTEQSVFGYSCVLVFIPCDNPFAFTLAGHTVFLTAVQANKFGDAMEYVVECGCCASAVDWVRSSGAVQVRVCAF
jgi:hypothetical protein